MSAPSVVIPYRAVGAKSRLAPALSEKRRAELSELMLLDVLEAFASAGLVGRCIVVSPDSRALALAQEAGAQGLRERSASGVNAAVHKAVSQERGDHGFMIVPADLPTLGAKDIRGALARHAAGLTVISPSRGFDGTNLLMFGESGRIPLSYDRDSFWNHVASAGRLGLPLCVLSAGGFMFDVDTPADLADLAGSGARGRAAAFAKGVLP